MIVVTASVGLLPSEIAKKRPKVSFFYSVGAIKSSSAVRVKRQPVVKFSSHRLTLPAKMSFPDFAFIGRSRAKFGELDPWQLLCDSSLLY